MKAEDLLTKFPDPTKIGDHGGYFDAYRQVHELLCQVVGDTDGDCLDEAEAVLNDMKTQCCVLLDIVRDARKEDA